MKKFLIPLTLASGLLASMAFAQLDYPFPQMVPDEYMQPGFYRSVDAEAFPQDMRNARSTYSNMIDNADVDALFEQRTFTGSRVFEGEANFSTQTLDYEIMYPPEDAVEPPDGFPLVFTTYGRRRLAEAMALDHFRENHPAYVVAFLHTERPGPLNAPPGGPAYNDFSFLFHELFDFLFEEYPIDENRIYGSGHSRGGSSLSILSFAKPERQLITAGVPSAGGFQSLEGPIEAIKNIKWFSLQGASDSTSNPYGSEHAFDQLEKAGALDNVFLWIENTGHSPDRVGWNVADIVEWMFAQTKADLTLRPDAVLDIDVTDAGVPLSFTADASASTPNNGGTITGYTWQMFKSQEAIADYSNRYLHGYTLDTGFQDAPVIGTGASVSETIEEPGTYWLRVIVEDDDGNRRAATQEIHARSVEPTAAFSFSRNHEAAGQSIHFDASESVPEYEATLSSFSWDFGDGNNATGETVAHAFATPGAYTVELTVTSSEGETDTVTHSVTVAEAFPGYRYFRFTGLDMHQNWNSPRIDEFAFLTGSTAFPREPMTSNQSQGIQLSATWNEGEVWRVFDQDEGTGWTHHNYFVPGLLEMDVGEDQRFVPTGFHIVMGGSNNRWSLFTLEASVDEETWDTLWEQDGLLDNDGEEILFEDVPFVEIQNVSEGTYGLGWEFALQASLTNMTGVTEVAYYANDSLIGSSSSGDDFEVLWTPTELGEFSLTAVATYDGGQQASWFPIPITMQPAPEITRIDMTPADMRVYPDGQVPMTAEAFDQFDNPLIPQPEFNWSVEAAAGSITSEGLYTAGSEFGEFDISVSATYEGDTLTANQSVIVVDAGNFCVEYFAGELLRPVWSFISKESWPGARADVEQGRITIQSRGGSMWQSTQEFSAIRRTDITGDFDVSVKVISQNENYTDDGSKVGIVVANDFNDLSQGGYLTLHTRGNDRVAFQREGTPGEISSTTIDDFPEGKDWPVWLRLVKSGTEFSTYYKFAEADEWEHLGTSTVSAAATDSQVALFASSNNTSKTVYGVFGDFIIADCDPGDFDLIPAAPEIVQQPQPVSVFEGGSITLTAEATGFPVITGYQWLKDGVEISNDHRISGAESAQLVIEDAQFSDQGAYTLAVTNDEGTTTTDEALVEVLPTPALYLLIDFGTNHTDPGDLWNSLNDSDTHTDLINSIDGEETSVEIDMITTSGSGIQTSGNNTAWGTRYIAPDWANSEALNDRLWVDQGHTATLRFRNLDPAKTYSVEIASGFGGSGSNGNEPGIFEVVGAGDAVEGLNAFSDNSLGTQVHWTSRGPTDGGNAPYAVEGWMIWKDVSPNSEGHIDVLLSTVSNSTARVSLNAARLIEMPEPVEQGPDIDGNPEGASLDAGESHTFSVLASGSGTLSYQWFKDGVEIEDATDASLTIDPAGVGDSGNYTVQVTDDNGSTMSDPAVLEVSGIELTLNASPSASELTYGQSLSEAVLSGGEVRNPSDEVVAGTFAFVEGAHEPTAGTESHAVLFSPENDFLYEPLTFDLSVTINPAVATLFFSDLSQSYNATGRSPSVSTDPGGLAVNITFDESEEAPVTVGEYPFEAEIADPNFTGSDSGTLTITAAPLEVTADDQLKGLDEPDPELTWSLTGGELFGGDVVSGDLTREVGETTGTYAIEQGTLTAGANYDLSFVEGTLTIVEVLEYTLSYHANGGSGPVPDSVTGDAGTQVGVSFEPAPTRDGFSFLGWKTDAGGVLADFPEGEAATVTLEEDVTLYAHWLSPWVLHENFEELGLGDIDGQGGWSADDVSQVVEDPEESSNRVFLFKPTNNDSASKSLPETVEDGESATIFFRFYLPQESVNFNQQMRFGDMGTFRLAFNGDNDSVLSLFYDGMGSGNSNVGIDQNIDRNTWYNVWVVLNGGTSLYEIYIEGGDYETPTRVTTAEDDPEKYRYAENANNPISSISWIGWDGRDEVLYDDFYLFPGGMSLDDPRPQDMAGSFDSWLEDASVPEGERGPFDSPARDGIANLLKYALGLDPMVPSNQLFASLEEPGLPWVVNDREVGEFRFYYRMDHSLSDITYHPQWSNDLVEWHDGGDFTEHSAGQEGDIEMREVRFNTEGQERAFFRLQIRREE